MENSIMRLQLELHKMDTSLGVLSIPDILQENKLQNCSKQCISGFTKIYTVLPSYFFISIVSQIYIIFMRFYLPYLPKDKQYVQMLLSLGMSM